MFRGSGFWFLGAFLGLGVSASLVELSLLRLVSWVGGVLVGVVCGAV